MNTKLFKNGRPVFLAIISAFLFLFAVGIVWAASTIGTNISTTGTLTVQSDSATAVLFQNAAGSTTIFKFDNTNSRFGILSGGTLDTTFEVGGTASISGIVTLANGQIRPRADSVTAFRLQNAAGTTSALTVDTTNTRVAVGTDPNLETTFEVNGVASVSNLIIGGNGTPILKHLSFTYSLNSATLTQKCLDLTGNTATGANVGDVVVPATNISGGMPASFSLQAFVTAANTIAFRWCEFGTPLSDPDGAGATYRADVWQH